MVRMTTSGLVAATQWSGTIQCNYNSRCIFTKWQLFFNSFMHGLLFCVKYLKTQVPFNNYCKIESHQCVFFKIKHWQSGNLLLNIKEKKMTFWLWKKLFAETFVKPILNGLKASYLLGLKTRIQLYLLRWLDKKM